MNGVEEGFYDGDICSYIRACLFGLVMACLVTLGIATMAWTLLDILLWCVVSLQAGYWSQVGMGGFMMLVVLGTLAIVGAVLGVIEGAKRLLKMFSDNIINRKILKNQNRPLLVKSIASLKRRHVGRLLFDNLSFSTCVKNKVDLL